MKRLSAVLGIVVVLVPFCPTMLRADDVTPFPPGNGVMPYPTTTGSPTTRDGYGIVPGPPTAPMQSSRPGSWPVGAANDAGAPLGPPVSSYPPQPVLAGATMVGGAMVLARVYKEVVLAHDVEGGFDDFFDQIKGRMPTDQIDEQRKQIEQEMKAGLQQLQEHENASDPGLFVDMQRRGILQNLIHKQVESKLIYLDFQHTVPKENQPNIEMMLNRQFDQMQLPVLLKREGVQSREELEHKLRAKGSSLERERRIFTEKLIARQWIYQQLKVDEEVTHEQMLDWYQSHLAEFEKPARVRWEEMMISFSRHASHEEAYATIAALGNQVLAGASLADVAKARSDGSTASRGGQRDWTTKGSLVSTELDQAIFSLPLGRLSPIIESKSGYHIVRVTERQEASRTPFLEAQKEIKEKIKKDRMNKQSQEFLDKLRKSYPVWTIFDETMKKAERHGADEPSRY